MNIDHGIEPLLLALAVRASRYGYAVFNGPTRLLDWGAGEIVSHDSGNAVGMRRVAFLFRHFPPSAVALTWSVDRKAPHHARALTFANFVHEQAALQQVPVIAVKSDAINYAFKDLRAHTKYDIAEALTRIFTELAWKLPPRRKSWHNEHHMMIVFDAVAIGFAYWKGNAC